MKTFHVITGMNAGGAEAMLLELVTESKHWPEQHFLVSKMLAVRAPRSMARSERLGD